MLNFDRISIFNKIQLSNAKENASLSKSATFEDKIKIKRRAQRTILLPVKCQKLMLSTSNSKQIRTGQIVKPMLKLKKKTMLLPETNNTKIFITLLVKLLNNNWKEYHTFINQEDILYTGLNSLYILTISLHKVNSTDINNFIFAKQLDVKELEIYK